MSSTVSVQHYSRPLVVVVQVFFAFLAVVSVAGSFVFSFSRGDLAGYAFGVVIIALGVAFAVTALRLQRPRAVVVRAAVGLAGLEFLWSIYKVFVVEEVETSLMLVLSGIAAVILLVLARRNQG
jgi:hypothetical protein